MARIARNNWLKKIGILSAVMGSLLLGGMNHSSYAFPAGTIDNPDILAQVDGFTMSSNPTTFSPTGGVAFTFHPTASTTIDLSSYAGNSAYPFLDLSAAINAGALGSGTNSFQIYYDTNGNSAFDMGIEQLLLFGNITSLTTVASTYYDFFFATDTNSELYNYYKFGGIIEVNTDGDVNIKTVVPEPSTILLLLFGVGGLGLLHRRKSRA